MPPQSKNLRLYLGVAVGVLAVSFAAIFIRLAEAPPLVIASYRLSIAAAVMIGLSLFSWIRRRPAARARLSWRDIGLVGVASLSLALHFWAWTYSLEYTSVASSVVLVTTSPFVVALASRILFGERIAPRTLAGIAAGVAGGLVIAVGDSGGPRALLGDVLAFLGAVAIVGYILVGRYLRRHLSALGYNTSVYSCTAVLLLLFAVVSGESFRGYTTQTYLWLVLLALGPQVIGHSLLNWSLAHLTATTVAIAVMAEPVIATAAALPFLGEHPPLASVVGGILILGGIYIALPRH